MSAWNSRMAEDRAPSFTRSGMVPVPRGRRDGASLRMGCDPEHADDAVAPLALSAVVPGAALDLLRDDGAGTTDGARAVPPGWSLPPPRCPSCACASAHPHDGLIVPGACQHGSGCALCGSRAEKATEGREGWDELRGSALVPNPGLPPRKGRHKDRGPAQGCWSPGPLTWRLRDPGSRGPVHD